MRRCAFLTMLDPSGFVIDDELAHEPLCALGWRVEEVPWQQPVHRLDRETARQQAEELEAYFSKRPLMVQPFAGAVREEGEYSLLYFDGEHSHTISKQPRDDDFRVQEEYGAEIRRITADAALRAAGEAVLEALGSKPLYARADFVRSNDGGSYWLMELELIEPALYLRMDPEAPGRFARALHARADDRGR